jgi:hypothetical protein
MCIASSPRMAVAWAQLIFNVVMVFTVLLMLRLFHRRVESLVTDVSPMSGLGAVRSDLTNLPTLPRKSVETREFKVELRTLMWRGEILPDVMTTRLRRLIDKADLQDRFWARVDSVGKLATLVKHTGPDTSLWKQD